MFSFIKDKLKKLYTGITQQMHALFVRTHIDQGALQELEHLLIAADTGVKTTKNIMEQLQKNVRNGSITKGSDLRTALREQLLALIPSASQPSAQIYLLVGINGTGKTTFAAKLANRYKQQGKKVLLVAGDTFRAAAQEQLHAWAQRINVDIFQGKPGQDPASVIFQACEHFKQSNYDILIIDTAGRLQTKVNLMRELEKIKRSIAKQLPTHSLCTILTVDAMLGQNSFEQAKVFHESTKLDGIALTKMDGTGKGGIVFAIMQELGVPILYISYGEGLEDIQIFDAPAYIDQLLTF